MILKRIKDFPPKQVGTYTGDELAVISDTTYNAKVKLSELREYVLTGSGLLYSGGTGILNVTGSGIFSGDVTIYGELNVQTINQISVDNLNVRDKTISLNVSGTNATSTGSGIIVNGTGNVVLSNIVYSPTLSSSWQINGSEAITSSPTQSLLNKTIFSPKISGFIQYETASVQFSYGNSPVIPNDRSYIFVSSSNFTASLNSVTSQTSWRPLNIKNISLGDLMISASSGQRIDDVFSITIRSMDSIQLIGDPSNSRWWIFNYSVGNPMIII